MKGGGQGQECLFFLEKVSPSLGVLYPPAAS